jgi:predicted DCC family thiol-disulfide oxidoreductase YuxK
MAEEDNKKIEVFYDGKCPMCTAIMSKVDASTQREHFTLRDITKDPLPPDFTTEEVEKEIHVVAADGKVYKNADAILKILEQYPRFRWLAKLGQFPLIKPLLPLGYRIVAANRRFLFGPASRIFWLKVVVAVGFAASLLISSGLWLSSRLYPLTPVIAGLPTIPHPFDYIVFIALFGLLAATVFSSRPRPFIWSFIALMTFLCALDQSRWQPWVFQYLFMLGALGLFSWKSEDAQGQKITLNILRLIIFGTYLYSGLQKINLDFINSVFPWLVQPIVNVFPAFQTVILPLAIIAPFIQIGFACGLLTKRFRNEALLLAVSMHIFILGMIGPFGWNWNSVVWPWTTAMACFDILLFAGTSDFTFRDIFWAKNSAYQKVVLVLFIVMPLLSFFNIWDSYLSAALYSGNTNQGTIYMSDEVEASLPTSVQAYVSPISPNTNALNIQNWSIAELGVPPYPENRIYESVAKEVCVLSNNPTQLNLVIQDERMFNDGLQRNYTCADLQTL